MKPKSVVPLFASLFATSLATGLFAACSLPASAACEKYVECQAHFDEVTGNDTRGIPETYGEGGTCWQNAETADSCTAACENANTSLRDTLEATNEQLGPCQ